MGSCKDDTKMDATHLNGIKKEIVDIVDKIEDEQLLKRIYALAEYLYINK